MKKITMILGVSIMMMSCGDDTQATVCECSKLYDDASAAGDKAEANGGDWVAARQAYSEAHQEASEMCEKFHKELGDEKFHTMSKECK